MAVINSFVQGSRSVLVRQGSAQANTGQEDWVNVPKWARYATVDFDLTAVAGTTPLADLSIRAMDWVTRDDASAYNLAGHAAFTQISAAAHLVVNIGPGVTGIADDTTTAATGASQASLNVPLPVYLGLKLVFDRTTGDETYTYNLSVAFQ